MCLCCSFLILFFDRSQDLVDDRYPRGRADFISFVFFFYSFYFSHSMKSGRERNHNHARSLPAVKPMHRPVKACIAAADLEYKKLCGRPAIGQITPHKKPVVAAHRSLSIDRQTGSGERHRRVDQIYLFTVSSASSTGSEEVITTFTLWLSASSSSECRRRSNASRSLLHMRSAESTKT